MVKVTFDFNLEVIEFTLDNLYFLISLIYYAQQQQQHNIQVSALHCIINLVQTWLLKLQNLYNYFALLL